MEKKTLIIFNKYEFEMTKTCWTAADILRDPGAHIDTYRTRQYDHVCDSCTIPADVYRRAQKKIGRTLIGSLDGKKVSILCGME